MIGVVRRTLADNAQLEVPTFMVAPVPPFQVAIGESQVAAIRMKKTGNVIPKPTTRRRQIYREPIDVVAAVIVLINEIECFGWIMDLVPTLDSFMVYPLIVV